MIWSAPAVANGKVYIGLASDCDKPLIQGTLYALDENTGAVVAKAKMVPDAYVGGGIWSAPTIDATTGTVIISTGSIEKSPPYLPMAASLVTLDWNTLVPSSERIKDTDWSCTPTLFPGPDGLLFDSQGRTFEIRDQSTGNVLFSFTISSRSIKGPVTVLNGMVYVPGVDGNLYVLGL